MYKIVIFTNGRTHWNKKLQKHFYTRCSAENGYVYFEKRRTVLLIWQRFIIVIVVTITSVNLNSISHSHLPVIFEKHERILMDFGDFSKSVTISFHRKKYHRIMMAKPNPSAFNHWQVTVGTHLFLRNFRFHLGTINYVHVRMLKVFFVLKKLRSCCVAVSRFCIAFTLVKGHPGGLLI